MEMTTGAVLRRITRTELSMAAHKLATLILDGMTWKEGYNGLPKGCAGFTMTGLAGAMGVSRQYVYTLLAELESSELQLTRDRIGGGSTLWLFRFGCYDADDETPPTTRGDKPLYSEESNKTFTGLIEIEGRSDVSLSQRWLARIAAVKDALPCRGFDARHIWERFRAFNRSRGHSRVPAGWLLGFMRKWRVNAGESPMAPAEEVQALSKSQLVLQSLIARAPVANRDFQERALRKSWGDGGYEQRLKAMMQRFGCGRFSAALAVHGAAVGAGGA